MGYWPGFGLQDGKFEEIDGHASTPAEHGIVKYDMYIDGGSLGSNGHHLDGIWTTSEKNSYTVGYYEGTKWVEKSIEIDTPYCIVQEKTRINERAPRYDSSISAPCEKTKEGYFICQFVRCPGRTIQPLHQSLPLPDRNRLTTRSPLRPRLNRGRFLCGDLPSCVDAYAEGVYPFTVYRRTERGLLL